MVTTRRRLGGGAGRRLERLALAFDDERAVANAGLVLVSTLTWRLGIGTLAIIGGVAWIFRSGTPSGRDSRTLPGDALPSPAAPRRPESA